MCFLIPCLYVNVSAPQQDEDGDHIVHESWDDPGAFSDDSLRGPLMKQVHFVTILCRRPSPMPTRMRS